MGGGHGKYQTPTIIRDRLPENSRPFDFHGGAGQRAHVHAVVLSNENKESFNMDSKAHETVDISFQLDLDDRQLLGKAIAPEHISDRLQVVPSW